MRRDPYSPEQAAQVADLLWAAVAVMLAGELVGDQRKGAEAGEKPGSLPFSLPCPFRNP